MSDRGVRLMCASTLSFMKSGQRKATRFFLEIGRRELASRTPDRDWLEAVCHGLAYSNDRHAVELLVTIFERTDLPGPLRGEAADKLRLLRASSATGGRRYSGAVATPRSADWTRIPFTSNLEACTSSVHCAATEFSRDAHSPMDANPRSRNCGKSRQTITDYRRILVANVGGGRRRNLLHQERALAKTRRRGSLDCDHRAWRIAMHPGFRLPLSKCRWWMHPRSPWITMKYAIFAPMPP